MQAHAALWEERLTGCPRGSAQTQVRSRDNRIVEGIALMSAWGETYDGLHASLERPSSTLLGGRLSLGYPSLTADRCAGGLQCLAAFPQSSKYPALPPGMAGLHPLWDARDRLYVSGECEALPGQFESDPRKG
jgi:hypothetical protein